MDWRWFLVITTIYFHQVHSIQEITTQINIKKLMQYLPDRFLSMTVDPFTILAAGPLTHQSLNMAKGLSPCLVRISGKGTNILQFGKEFMKDNNTISESQWNSVYKFIKDAGMDLILSLNPAHKVQEVWTSQNSLELISYSAKEGFDVAWQFGYDIQSTNATGTEVGRNLVRLRKILDGFPKYESTAIFGPDITWINGVYQMQFLRNMLKEAGTTIPSLIIQPDFHEEGTEDSATKINTIMSEMDKVWNKNKTRSATTAPKKPIWIAESTPSKGTFNDAMVLLKRLGAAAQSGCQVFFRQPGVTALKAPTPEFWASILYKSLVGRGVLETKIVSNDRNDLHIYSHCASNIPQHKSVLDKDIEYDKTAVTVFGINESPDSIRINLKASNKDEEIHMYALTSGKQMGVHEYPQPTMLNGQQLRITPTGDLPALSPIIRQPGKDTIISIPPMSIFFLVMPNIRAKTCTSSPLITLAPGVEDLTKNLKFLTSETEKNIELEKSLYESNDNKNDHEKSSIVSLRKRQISEQPLSRLDEITEKYRSLTRSLLARFPRRSRENQRRRDEIIKQDDLPVKYITFNDNSWLNKLKETMSSIKLLENKNADAKLRPEENRANLEKYAPLTSAIVGTERSMKEDDDRINLRLKRSSTINPERYTTEVNNEQKATTGTIEISNLPENVINTLKQVQVTFTNMDDPKILSELNENSEPKRISLRHVGENKNNDENQQFEKCLERSTNSREEIMSEAIPKSNDQVDEDTKDIEKLLTGLTDSQTIPNDGTLEKDLLEEEESINDKISEIYSTEDKTNIQKITQEMIDDATKTPTPEVMMSSPKEKIINNIMMDIIKKENNEEVPMITGIINNKKIGTTNDQKINSLLQNANGNFEKVIIPIEKQGMVILMEENSPNVSLVQLEPLINSNEQNKGLRLSTTSDPYELEDEITKTSKGEIKSKIPRQISDSQKINVDEDVKSDTIVERLPGYTAEEDITTEKVESTVNTTLTKESPKQIQNSLGLNLPLLPKDLNIKQDNLLEAGRERIEAIKEKLKETRQKLITVPDTATLNENLWNSIRKREEELRELFKKFDKRETNFSPYEGARGIQFVTSVPVNSEMLSGYQLDPIKNRPRRLSQPAKINNPELHYDGNLRSYHKPSNQYIQSSNQQHSQHKHYAEPQNLECDRCELAKSENQYLFPLDSKTQGIVYNNKIYPAKLFGMVDVPNQQETVTNDAKYNDNIRSYKTRGEVQYVEKLPIRKDIDRYSSDIVDDYVDTEVDYPTEYISTDQTKKIPHTNVQKEINDQQQPYIPVVILSHRDKQYLPRTKSERQRRSIDVIKFPLNQQNKSKINEKHLIKTNKRLRRKAMFNPASINDVKYRYKLKNKLDKEFNEIIEQKNTSFDPQLINTERNSNMDNEKSNDAPKIGTCQEIGSSSESIILEDNKMISPQREAKYEKHIQEMKTTRSPPEDNQKESKEEETTTHDIFTMIRDKLKNFMGYVNRIFDWNNQ